MRRSDTAPLVFGAKWVSTEEEWDDPLARSFYGSSLGTTSSCATTGWAQVLRSAPRRPPTVEKETSVLRAVLDACGGERATVFACSCASVVTSSLAAQSPERVEKVVFFGSYVSRDDLPEATRRSIVDFVRVNWALAAQMLAGLIAAREW
jgi:pimeloyl-ACP methyl ester carboxylesterase